MPIIPDNIPRGIPIRPTIAASVRIILCFVSYLDNSSSFVLQDAVYKGDIYFYLYNEEVSYSKLKECLNNILQKNIAQDGKIMQKSINCINFGSSCFAKVSVKERAKLV